MTAVGEVTCGEMCCLRGSPTSLHIAQKRRAVCQRWLSSFYSLAVRLLSSCEMYS